MISVSKFYKKPNIKKSSDLDGIRAFVLKNFALQVIALLTCLLPVSYKSGMFAGFCNTVGI